MAEESIEVTQGTLKEGEPHPSAYEAIRYLQDLGLSELAIYSGSFASCSLSGNRDAEILSETLHRFMTGEPVSDRYLLGLAWAIRDVEDKKSKKEGA